MRQTAICDIDACHGFDDLETLKRHNRLETGVACVLHTNEIKTLLEGCYRLDSNLHGAVEVRGSDNLYLTHDPGSKYING